MQSPDIDKVIKELEKVKLTNSPNFINSGKRKRTETFVTKLQKTEKKIYQSLMLNTIPDKRRKVYVIEKV
jgi:hypothetical protein